MVPITDAWKDCGALSAGTDEHEQVSAERVLLSGKGLFAGNMPAG